MADVALAVLNDAVDVFDPVVERAYVVPDTCTVPCTLYSVVKGVVNVARPTEEFVDTQPQFILRH